MAGKEISDLLFGEAKESPDKAQLSIRARFTFEEGRNLESIQVSAESITASFTGIGSGAVKRGDLVRFVAMGGEAYGIVTYVDADRKKGEAQWIQATKVNV